MFEIVFYPDPEQQHHWHLPSLVIAEPFPNHKMMWRCSPIFGGDGRCDGGAVGGRGSGCSGGDICAGGGGGGGGGISCLKTGYWGGDVLMAQVRRWL